MSVVRVVKTRGYTVMSNFHLRDGRLSLKAKGLLSVMLSLPEEWDYTVRGLASISLEGVDAVRTGLLELEAAGYVERERVRDARGRLAGCDYTVYERPPAGEGDAPDAGAPALGNPAQDAPAQGMAAQSIKEGKGKEGSIKEPIEYGPPREGQGADSPAVAAKPREPRRRHGEYGNVLLTDSQLAKLESEFPSDWQARIARLDSYIETSGRRYRNHLAVIRGWAADDARKAGAGAKAPAAVATDYAYGPGDVL